MNQPKRAFRGNLSDTDLVGLRDFIEIVDAGGITAAQARLGKGKSAISLGLTRLEERLSMRLCERGRSGFRLTEQGQMVHSAALQLLSEIGRFNDFVGAATDKLEDEISFLCDDSFLFEFGEPLARAITRISDRYPKLTLNVRMSSPDHIYASVLEGSSDLGFTALIHQNQALTMTPVCTEKMGIFCGKGHPLFAQDDRQITRTELQRHAFVAAEVTQEAEFSEFVQNLSFAALAPTIMSRMLLVLSSRYLGFMPLSFAQPWVERGEIRELSIEGSRAVNTCYLIHRKARPQGIGCSILARMIIEELSKP